MPARVIPAPAPHTDEGATRAWSFADLRAAHPLPAGWCWGWSEEQGDLGWFAYCPRAVCVVRVLGDDIEISADDAAHCRAPDEVAAAVFAVRFDVSESCRARWVGGIDLASLRSELI